MRRVPLFVGTLFTVLLLATLLNFIYQKPAHPATMMAQDIARLAAIFERIEKECGIISFNYQKNPINFLTIKKDGFVGSEIGSMNLAHPDKWQGPYVNDNLTMQGKEYQVVRTNSGYFITPGEQVELPNGKWIGRDIILDEKADIAAMMHNKNELMFEGKSLAAAILTEKVVINAALLTALEDE